MNLIGRVSREIALRIDQSLGSNIKPALGDVYRSTRRVWSVLRRVADPLCIRIRYALAPRKLAPLFLHLGCGPNRLPGYVNMDLWITDATDVIGNIEKLPWPDESAAAIECHHVIEHISHRKIEAALSEWRRVLIPGGSLAVETPHFDEAIQQYLQGNEERLLSIFGRQRRLGDAHLYGYNPERLTRLLEKSGFSDIRRTEPQSHQAGEEPVFRMECRKN